ncbi:LptA/OstA family protein [Hypericibacter sp.]|uniref:LptA/OstA family protein n=1 Tax=Hypericibacter sp. TaxID=2705401 RepID=UPI003D6D5743
MIRVSIGLDPRADAALPTSRRRFLLGSLGGFLAFGAIFVAARPAWSEAAASVDAPGNGLDLTNSSAPIEIEADDGIEWRRDDKVYIARGKARAKRGDLEVNADVLSAYYRESAKGSSDIYRVTAEGNVLLISNSDKIWGDRAVYDLDQGSLVVTGQNIRAQTQKQTLTARDSLEYWQKQLAMVARGNAEVVEGDRRVKADLLTGYMRKNPDGKTELYQVEAKGHVRIWRGEDYAQASTAVYNLDSDIATLDGSVKITRGQNQLNGDRAEFDMKTGVSRILGQPGTGSRVHTLIFPGQGTTPTAP